MATHPIFLPRKSHGQRSLVAIAHGVTKSQTQLSDFTFTFFTFHPKKEFEADYGGDLRKVPCDSY